jgi:hypothetical protein
MVYGALGILLFPALMLRTLSCTCTVPSSSSPALESAKCMKLNAVQTHASILGWAAEQATQLWLHPSRIRTHAVRFALAYEPDRRKPHQFVLEGVRVARVPHETADLDEGWIARCRSETDELTSNGGLGMLMYALECGDVCEYASILSRAAGSAKRM